MFESHCHRGSEPEARRGKRLGTRSPAYLLGLVVATATMFAIGAARGQECAGDCEGSDTVAINELIGCVGIALGTEPLGTCDACDSVESANLHACEEIEPPITWSPPQYGAGSNEAGAGCGK